LVYRRCCSSPNDRIRFAAVCSSWRVVASWHPKLSALPLLLPSTGNAERDRKARAYVVEDGRALRRPLPGFPCGERIVGSHDGGWVAALTGTRLCVVNVFSGDRVELSARQSIVPTRKSKVSTVSKIIFSDDPSSSGCILAALTPRCKVALCRISCPDAGWTVPRSTADFCNEQLTDIAFCNGMLYALTTHGELYSFVIGMNRKRRAPVVTSMRRIRIEMGISSECWGKSHDKYIFELRGKMAIALKFSPRSYCCSDHSFRVFELDDIEYKSTEVTSLGDHALFLGPACCKAVHMPVTGERNRVRRNHIYYCEQQLCPQDETDCLQWLGLGSTTVFYGKNEGANDLHRIAAWGYHYGYDDESDGCIWIFPPEY
jgi:hypothetical protein